MEDQMQQSEEEKEEEVDPHLLHINSPFKYQSAEQSLVNEIDDNDLISSAHTPKSQIHDSNYSDVEESDSGGDIGEVTSPIASGNNGDTIVLHDGTDYGKSNSNVGPILSPPFFDHNLLTSRTNEGSVDNNVVAGSFFPQAVMPCALPAGWEEFQSDEGWTYYYHAGSQVSTWDHPMSTAGTTFNDGYESRPADLSTSSIPCLNESLDEVSSEKNSAGGHSGSLFTSMNAKGQSALHISAAQNMVEGLSILLLSEISADILDVNGRTSLQLVCMNYPEHRQLQCMKVLIDYGADINFLDNRTGNSLLHFCILTGNAPGLEALLAAGADSNKVNLAGDTPLHLAAKSAQFECMQKLVLFGNGSAVVRDADGKYLNDEGERNALRNKYSSNHSSMHHTHSHEAAWGMYETARRNGFTSNQSPQSYAEFTQQRSQRLTRNRGKDLINRQSTFEEMSISSKGSGSINIATHSNGLSGKDKAETAPQPEWVELVTPAGDLYFYNALEQRVQWESPYEVSGLLNAGVNLERGVAQVEGLFGDDSEDYYGDLYKSSSQRNAQASLRERIKQRTLAEGIVDNSYNKTHAAAAGMNTSVRDTRLQEKTIRQSGGMSTKITQPSVASMLMPSEGRHDPDPDMLPPKPSSMSQVNPTLIMTPPSTRVKDRSLVTTNKGILEAATRIVPSNKSLTRSISDDTISDLSDHSQSALSTKERHIKVWTRFFENAMNAKSSGKSALADYDEETREKSTKLIAAVMECDFSHVERLLLGGADANFVDENMRSPAHYASKIGSVFFLALLYEYNADLEIRDGNGHAPLHIACIVGVSDSVKFLLESAVAVDCKDKFGYTPLHLAAISGHLHVCEILLEYGAALDSMNSYDVDILKSVQNVEPKSDVMQRMAEYLESVLKMRNDGISKEVPKQQSSRKAGAISRSSVVSTPWISLSINTDVADNNFSSIYNSSRIGTTYDRKPQQLLEGTDGDDYEDENDYDEYDDDDKSGIADSVSGAVWGVASTLLGATISMFKKSEKCSSKSDDKYGHNFGAGSALSLASKNQHIWDSRAPPTDTELHCRGLGPPPFVADQLQAGVESIRTGATPRRNVSAPVEVKLAVDWYRRNSSPNVTPKNTDASFDGFSGNNNPHTNPANKPVSLFEYAAAVQAKQAANCAVPNQYSLSTVQKKGPSGYPQYVDIFANSSALNK